MLGGVVISQTKTTAVHAMGYSLTYFKNIDHGRANGLLLGEFTKYIERNDKDRVKEILSCMNLNSAEEFKNILAKILGDKEKFEKYTKAYPQFNDLFIVKPEFLQAGLDQINKQYGNVDNFLTQQLKVDFEKIRNLYLY